MAQDVRPYVVAAKGWQRLVRKFSRTPFTGDTLLIVDQAGIHWPGGGGVDFVLAWEEIAEVIRQRRLGSWYLVVVVKDVDRALARYPMQNLASLGNVTKLFSASPFVIPAGFAPLDEVIAAIHRFSTVSVRNG